MKVLIKMIVQALIVALICITVVDVYLMGRLTPRFAKKPKANRFIITKKNQIDYQKANECSGYSISYILRHYGIQATGEEIYNKIANKMLDGCVYPKEVKKMLEEQGFHVTYCTGNLNAIKKEISKGNPVIAFIKVRKGKPWTHYVPVVGYDDNTIYLAESLPEFVNCNESVFNRTLSNKEFLALWNTSMIKMPLYRHTYFSIEKDR